MVLVIALAFGLTVVIPLVLFPKVRVFLNSWRKKLVLTSEDTNIVLVAITFTSMLFITGVSFVLYKVACSAWAYLYTGNLVDQLVYSRGVFSMEIANQTPFHYQSLLSLLGTVALQMGAALFLYRSVGAIMRRLNQSLSSTAFNQESQLVFSFLGTCLFIAIDIVFYAQDIAVVSQYANILLLVLAKMSMLSSLICVIHWQLSRKRAYLSEVRRYLLKDSPWHYRLAQPVWVLSFGYAYALLSHLPAFLGLQFLQNNLVLFMLNGLVLFLFFMYGYKRVFRQILDVLGRIMLLPEIGKSGLTPLWSVRIRKRWYYAIPAALCLIALFRAPAILAFYLVMPVALAGFLLIGLALVVLLISGLLYGSVMLRQGRYIGLKSLLPEKDGLMQAGKTGLFSLLHTLKPVGMGLGLYLLVLSAFPKAYPELEEKYSRSVLGRQGQLLYQELSNEGFYAMPMNFEAIPPHFAQSLLYQEDRGFMKQQGLLPNGSNWFGLSFAALRRFMSHGGGGSNLNMQLVKNEAYQGRRVQDVQRKFYELIAAFQLSLRLNSEDIMALYLNRVPLYGGRDFKGLYMASQEAFGLPPDQLNELQALLLIWSLKNSNAFRLENGDRVRYSQLYRFETAVKSVLVKRFELWKRQGLLSEADFQSISRKRLALIGPDRSRPLQTATREFVKAHFAQNHGVITTSLSEVSQAAMEQVATFATEFNAQMQQGPFNLAYGSVAVEVATGRILAHLSHGPTTSDLVDFGHGYPVGSLMKPPIIMSLLESGFTPSQIKLYDGKAGHPVAPNFSHRYSNEKVGIEPMLALSLNAPFNNIAEIADPRQIFKKNEALFDLMQVARDPAIDLDDKKKKLLNQINYPLGNRRMTMLEVAQVYQTLFNKGAWVPLSLADLGSDESTAVERSLQVYEKQHCEWVKKAMAATIRYGTGWRLKSRLPKSRTYYAKTGTSDKATHGWTVLSDGKILVVSWLSYAKVTGDKIDFNDQSRPIPFGSGSQSAGVLAAMVYTALENQKFKNSGRFSTLYSRNVKP